MQQLHLRKNQLGFLGKLFGAVKDFIAPAVATAIGGPVLGAAVSGGLSLLGGAQQREGQIQQAATANAISEASTAKQMEFQLAANQKQMDFQERMSGTAHQREITDLRAAGLNPILSARYGGATTPSGATSGGASFTGQQAQIPDIITPAVQQYWSAKSVQQGVQLQQAQTRNQNAEATNRENLAGTTGNVNKIAEQLERIIDRVGEHISPENLEHIKNQLPIDGKKAVDAVIKKFNKLKMRVTNPTHRKDLNTKILQIIEKYWGNTTTPKMIVNTNKGYDTTHYPDYIPPKLRTKYNMRRP